MQIAQRHYKIRISKSKLPWDDVLTSLNQVTNPPTYITYVSDRQGYLLKCEWAYSGTYTKEDINSWGKEIIDKLNLFGYKKQDE